MHHETPKNCDPCILCEFYNCSLKELPMALSFCRSRESDKPLGAFSMIAPRQYMDILAGTSESPVLTQYIDGGATRTDKPSKILVWAAWKETGGDPILGSLPHSRTSSQS